MTTSETVLAALDDGVLTLTLNRPDKLNAFTDDMYRILRAQMERARDDRAIRTVLLTGAGRAFCAGQDLGDRDPRKGARVDLGRTLDTSYNPLLRLIRSLEKPVICAVNGVAAGAGANVAFACDIVLAANTGYRPGWVHFAMRSAREVDLIRFLADHAPPGADENYGSGHRAATGGALRPADWNHFITGLGFGPEQQVQEAA